LKTATDPVRIDTLGAQGDGVAEAEGGKRYIPFALPGETVIPSGRGLPEILGGPSPERRMAECRHFGACGGCVAQHMSDPLYTTWKRDFLVSALRQRGLEPAVAPLVRVPPGTRRRAVFTSRRDGDEVQLGYLAHRSHALVDITECTVLRPEIVAALGALRAIARAIPERELRLAVLATRGGLDVAVEGTKAKLAGTALRELAHAGAQTGIARLTVGDVPVIERAPATIRFGGSDVALPPNTFVQAAEEAEAELVRLVLAAAKGAKSVADLFCGVGVFALALAASARVLAIDSAATSVAALTAAARSRSGLKPIDTKVRDLLRDPLSPRELAGLDAVAFDPPRAGARAQAEQLARSRVPTIVAVSCDPGTLARDLRILADGGYAIEAVTPVDQFVYSAHVEAVAVLRRVL
jgi:23S rRNA (uracil1939-C5)-methyltransferase